MKYQLASPEGYILYDDSTSPPTTLTDLSLTKGEYAIGPFTSVLDPDDPTELFVIGLATLGDDLDIEGDVPVDLASYSQGCVSDIDDETRGRVAKGFLNRNRQSRNAQLVARIKRRRGKHYDKPRPGGQSKQARTRLPRFTKHATHDQKSHGNWAHGRSPGHVLPSINQPSFEGMEAPDRIKRLLNAARKLGYIDEYDKPDDHSDYQQLLDEAYSDWVTWQGSKDIRAAAVEILGAEPSDVPADPHLDAPPPAGTWYSAAAPHIHARGLMEELVAGGNSDAKILYRSIDLASADPAEREFFHSIKPGDEFDAPLLGFLNTEPVIGTKNLLDTFGGDMLIEVEGNPVGWDTGSAFASPYWFQSDEDQWLGNLHTNAPEFFDQLELGVGDWGDPPTIPFGPHKGQPFPRTAWMATFDSQEEAIGDFRSAIDDYRHNPDHIDNRGYMGWWLDNLDIEKRRFAGEKISEYNEPWAYYGWAEEAEYMEGYPREVISGGRFKVVSVSGDPRGKWPTVVRVRQLGVFDPLDPEHLVKP